MNNGQIIRQPQIETVAPTWPRRGLSAPIDILPSDTTDAIKYSAILRRYRMPILTIIALSLLVSIVVTVLSDKIYRCTTVLEVMAMNQDFMNSKSVDPTSAVPSQDAYVETETKLIVSDSVTDRVVAALRNSVPEQLLHRQTLWNKVASWVGFSEAEPSVSPDSIVRGMLKDIKVKQEGQSSLISVTVYGADPQFTAQVTNTLSNEYIESDQEARWATASRTADFLTRQLEGSRQKLQVSEDALQRYASSANLVLTDASHEDVATEKLREIQSEVSHAQADLAIRRSQMDLLRSSNPDALPEVLDDGVLRDYKAKIADLRRQLADLSTTLTPANYKVERVQAQIVDLERQMQQQRANIIQRIRNDYDSAERREQILNSAYDAQLGRVSQQSAKEVRYNILKREVDADREIYESMLQRVKEATVMSALRASNVRVVDPAKRPYMPFKPSLAMNLALGGLTGCIISLLFVLIRERSDRSFRTPGQSLRYIDVPELAVIPSAKLDVHALTTGPRSDAASSEMRDGGLIKWSQRQSLLTESFRSAVTSILMARVNGYQPRVIVITSAHPEAGKTTTVLNLGVGLAEIGRKVLVIDGDLRKPRLGALFGLQNVDGLSDILSGTTEKLAMDTVIRATQMPGMFILPSGSTAVNVPQLLHSARMDSVIAKIRTEFDVVLIDSPPMITLTDARLLGRNADGVVLVCRSGKTQIDQLLVSRRRLAEDGIHVLGTILTDWNPLSEDPSYLNTYNRYTRGTA